MPSVGPATRLIALLGDPVEHSLSPAFQNAAIEATGLDAVYLALRCEGESLPGLLRGIAAAGGAGNVTLPHKRLAAGLLDEATDAVALTGACNTFWREGERLIGDNTDVSGVAEALRVLLPDGAAGARVLLLGAGGAARAALVALLAEPVEHVCILNRTPETARVLASDFGRRVSVMDMNPLDELTGFDLIVNATSLGLRGDDPYPVPPPLIPESCSVLDLVYRPGGTGWVRELWALGRAAADGTETLLKQGAASFERWWGVRPPMEVMRSALHGSERR